MNNLLLSIFLLVTFAMGAQCPSGIFTSQAQIDDFPIDFPDCTSLTSLIITGTDIVDLTPLSQLTSVDGPTSYIDEDGFYIQSTSLTSLLGLENIIEFNIIGIKISNNPLLENISALSSITGGVSRYLQVEDNPELETLIGLHTIRFLDGNQDDDCNCSWIINNDSLTSLEGLGAPASRFANFPIRENDGLLTLEGMHSTSFLVVQMHTGA